MRDGVFLTTYVTVPEPCDAKRSAVIDRTPYGPTVDFFGETYIAEGFVGIMQNQRGCFTSGGVYNFWKNDSTDAYDTMAWAVSQPWSNGKVMIAGVSADGISAYSDFIIPQPNIYGAYSMWASAYGHETCYWGGAYRYGLISHWLLTLDTCSNSKAIEQQVRDHESMDDWWQLLEANGPWGNHFPNVNASGVQQAGWWDIFQQGQIDTFEGTRAYGTVKTHWFWMIPLGHCTGSLSDFDYPMAEVLDPQFMSIRLFQGNFSADVFSYAKTYNFYVFGPVPKYIGLNATHTGNYWTSANEWPIYTPTRYYLNPGGYLSSGTPKDGNSTYTYDPANPAPTLGGNNLFGPCGPRDETSNEKRGDFLVFTSDVFTSNWAITGRINATLTVSTDAVDTDFYVSLNDVYPDGKSIPVRYGIIRMRWRNSATTPSLLTPNQKYTVNVDLWSTSYIFNSGHALRVTITSSKNPEFSVNPNNGKPLNDTSGPLIVAHNTVYYGATGGSYVSLPVVPITALPKNDQIR
jgi:hypothetical protein